MRGRILRFSYDRQNNITLSATAVPLARLLRGPGRTVAELNLFKKARSRELGEELLSTITFKLY